MFGMHDSALSEVFYENLNSLFDNCAKLVTNFRSDLIRGESRTVLNCSDRERWPTDKCVGFTDDTKLQIARSGGPTLCQRSVYSVHDRIRCLSYQIVGTPDSITFHLSGPVEGR